MVKKNWQNLSVLIVGCGSIGQRHARVLSRMGVTDLRACDITAHRIKTLTAQVPSVQPFSSFEAGLAAEPDCVWIMTPPRLHIPQAIEAVHAGCHVFSEKPLSDTLDGLDELKLALRTYDRKCMVGLCFRYHQGLLRAKQMLQAGEIGRLVSIRALMGEHIPDMRSDYRMVWTHDGIRWGAFDLTHEIDLAIWYAGQNITKVASVFGSFSDVGLETPDVAEIVMQFEDRMVASIHLDFFQRPRRRQIELIGTDGVIIVEFARWDTCEVSIWTQATERWERTTIPTDRNDMFRDENRAFLEAVADDLPVPYDLCDSVKSVEVVHAAMNGSLRGAVPA